MSLETRKVLDMLAAGKITAADAEKLLEKLESSSGAAEAGGEAAPSAQSPRFFRILVDEPGRKQVNIRMPLTFLRAGAGLTGVVPQIVTERLKERGIDLSVLRGKHGDELIDVLKNLQLDLDKGDGKKVRIFCE